MTQAAVIAPQLEQHFRVFLKSQNDGQGLGGVSVQLAAGLGMIAKAVAVQQANDQVVDARHGAAHGWVGHTGLVFLERHTRT